MVLGTNRLRRTSVPLRGRAARTPIHVPLSPVRALPGNPLGTQLHVCSWARTGKGEAMGAEHTIPCDRDQHVQHERGTTPY